MPPRRRPPALAALTGLPGRAIVVDTATVPRTANGKVDYQTCSVPRPVGDGAVGCAAVAVAGVYATVLGRRDVSPSSTFVSLGGDSLSYVECSVRLERLLGSLPADWHLRRSPSSRPGRPPRAAAARHHGAAAGRRDPAVVATHMHLWYFPGGAHLMLAVVGYNLSRFHLSIESTRDRVLAVLRSIGRVAIPVVAFVGTCMLLVGGYGLPTLPLVNNYLGPVTHLDGRWHYWFIEAMVQVLVLVTALLAIGPVRRLERRFPYLFPLLLLRRRAGAARAVAGRSTVTTTCASRPTASCGSSSSDGSSTARRRGPEADHHGAVPAHDPRVLRPTGREWSSPSASSCSSGTATSRCRGRHPGRRRRRRREHGHLRQPLPDLAAPRPQPAAGRRLCPDPGRRHRHLVRRRTRLQPGPPGQRVASARRSRTSARSTTAIAVAVD